MNIPEARRAIDQAGDRFEKTLNSVVEEFRKQMTEVWFRLLDDQPDERPTKYRGDDT